MAEVFGTGFIFNLVIDWTYDLLWLQPQNSKLNFKKPKHNIYKKKPS
jgi:hypothetical protein